MTEYTVGWLDAKITEVDALIFKADTAQISLTWEQYKALKDDAEMMMNLLAENVAQSSGRPIEEMYEARALVRRMNYFTATTARHLELYPNPNPKQDEMIRSAFHDSKSDEETTRKLIQFYGYMFANAPRDPNSAAPQKGFFRRLFSR